MVDEVDGAGLDTVLAAEEDRGVLVQFWGPWCAPCRALKPHIAKMADEYADAWRMVSINAEADELVTRRWGVSSVPTIVMLRRGEELHRFAGAAVPSQIAQKLEQLTR